MDLSRMRVHWKYFRTLLDTVFLQLGILCSNTYTLTDLILFHKIVYNQVKIDMPSYLVRLSPESVRAPRNQPIGSNLITFTSDIHPDNIIKDNDSLHFKSKITPKVDAYKYSFFHRTHLEWNKLPLKIRNYQDSDTFKVLLKEYMWKILLDKPYWLTTLKYNLLRSLMKWCIFD